MLHVVLHACVSLKYIQGYVYVHCVYKKPVCLYVSVCLAVCRMKPCKDLNYNAESHGHALQRFTIGDPANVFTMGWSANHSQSTNHLTTIVEYSFPAQLKQ